MPSRRPSRRSGGGGGWWPPPSVPIAVEGGLRARSTRGRIGDTWWSQRFVAVLESYGMGSRLQRGKRYARTGQVLSLEVGPGSVKASVQGSRTKPYRVFIEAGVLSADEWDAVEAAMAGRAVFAARLLAGEMPEEIEEAFTETSTTLFPGAADGIESACSCPDWENPCKHIAAVFFLLAEAFDDDPFLIFTWRGRSRDELLAGLRARRRRSVGDDGAVDDHTMSTDGAAADPTGWPVAETELPAPAGPGDPRRFWGADADVSAVEVRPRLAVAADLVLRQLDPAPLAPDGSSVTDRLRPLYTRLTTGALAVALGDEADDDVTAGG